MINFLLIYLNFLTKCSISLITLSLSFFLFLFIFISSFFFDKNYSSYQFIYLKFFSSGSYINYSIGFGVDGLSLIFLLLTTFLFFLVFLTAWKQNIVYVKEYTYSLLSLECFLLLVFSSLDLLTFFFLFETVLIPMFLIIGLWGTVNRKIYASLLFFLFTLAGSLCLFFVILIL